MNTKMKRKLKSIWGIIVLGLILIIIIPIIYIYPRAYSDVKKNINEINKQDAELVSEYQPVKDAGHAIATATDYNDKVKMHEAFQRLSLAVKEFEPKLEASFISVQQKIDKATLPSEKQIATNYLNVLNLRKQFLNKTKEFAEFGLKVDWSKPTKDDIAKLNQFGNELASINKQLENIKY